MGCLDGMQIGKRLLVVGILFLMLGMVMATQYAVTRTGYVFAVVHPSDANIRFIGSDLSGDGIRVLRAVNNGTTGTIQVSLGNFSAGCNKTYTAAFCIVNEESFVVNITHINVSTAGSDYLQIWLHGERKSDVSSDSGDVAFLWNKGVQVSQSTSTAWTLGQGNNDASNMDGSGATTLWDGTSGVRWSTYNTTAVNGTDDYVWVQISLDLPQHPSEDGETGALFIHFEASTLESAGGGGGLPGSEGPNSPGTMADDDTIGTQTWVDIDNAKTQSDTYAAGGYGDVGNPDDLLDKEVKIVKADTSLGAENKADAVAWQQDDDDTYTTYGGADDLWSENWEASDINNANFGVVISVDTDIMISHYLKATNFGFSIPEGATIDGIKVEIEKLYLIQAQGRAFAKVDHIKMTVYYTT